MNNKKHVCCICGKEFTGYGNNPWPIKKEGICCDKCGEEVVKARLKDIFLKQIDDEFKSLYGE